MDALLDLLTAHPVEYRWLAAGLGFLAALGHTFRLVTTWTAMPVLSHSLALLVGGFVVASSGAQYVAIQRGAPPNEFTLVFAALQLAVIVNALFWSRWLTRRTSPFRRSGGPRR